MVQTQNKNAKDVSPRLQRKLNNFLNSIGDVIIDITALEVNTIVVEEITANKFIPWEAYRDVYLISRQYLETKRVHPSLHNRYLSMRKNLEVEFCNILLDQETSAQKVSELRRYCQSLSEGTVEIDERNTFLPNPEDTTKVQNVLENGRVLRALRKIYELKVTLDSRNKALTNGKTSSSHIGEEITTDILYAQSIIQLDGDIINRYDQNLFKQKYKDLILDVHKQGVFSAQKQWHGLLEFMVGFVDNLVSKRGTNKDYISRN